MFSKGLPDGGGVGGSGGGGLGEVEKPVEDLVSAVTNIFNVTAAPTGESMAFMDPPAVDGYKGTVSKKYAKLFDMGLAETAATVSGLGSTNLPTDLFTKKAVTTGRSSSSSPYKTTPSYSPVPKTDVIGFKKVGLPSDLFTR